MSNLTAKQTQYLFIALVVIIFIVAFRFGYRPIMDKTNEIKEQNKELQLKVDELTEVMENEAKYREELETAKTGVDNIAKKYPPGITPQKSLVMLKELETETKMRVSTIAFGQPENIYTSTFVNENEENVIANKKNMTINYSVSYEGFKSAIDFLNENVDRMSISNFTAAYNQETGLLSGTMNINQYYVTGLGREYEEPAVGDVSLSVNNIFNTIK